MRFLIQRLGPWGWGILAIQALLVTRRHWQAASPADRARLGELAKKSGGRPSSLTGAERQEIVAIARRLEPARLARSLVSEVAVPGRRGRRK